MDHPARWLRFRFMAVLAPVAVILLIVVCSVVLMVFWIHFASSFLDKLLLRWKMHYHRASGPQNAATAPSR
jgi:hypothetical protein